MANGTAYETATVKSIGTAAGAATTLAAPVKAGDTNLKVTSTAGYNAGELMTVGVGKVEESALVTSVGTAGADGTGITVEPLAKAHNLGAAARGLGTGIGVSALTKAHAAGVAARDTAPASP